MAELLDFIPLFQENAATIRARINADANAGIPAHDARYVDTREGTFFYDITQPLVLEFARIYDALSLDVPAAAFVAFAWGEYLDRHAEVFALDRKAAVAAGGEVTFLGEPGTLVGTGAVVSADTVDEDGDPIEFVTTESGTVAARIDVPSGISVTPSGTGGTLPADDYFYAITALNAFGETTGSVEVSATVAGATSSVALDWSDVAGATGYRVYRGTVAGGDKALVYEDAASAFTDTNATAPTTAGPPEIDTTGGVTLAVEAVTPGIDGNLAAHSLTNLDSPNPDIDVVHNTSPTTGGAEEESDEELRERILLQYEGQGAGNVNDYKRWALDFGGVGRVFVNPVWAGPNTVQVVVMDSQGDPVSAGVIAGLQAYLDPAPQGEGHGQAPIGATVTVQTPVVEVIDVVATVTFEAGYSLDGGGGTIALREQLEKALATYIDALDVGEDVIYNHVHSQFFDVEGVLNVSGVTVEGGTADVAITTDPPQIAQLGTVSLSG